jgi:hypothetical protein
MTNDKFCLTRIENEVRTKLNALAEKDCRSIPMELRWLVEQELLRREVVRLVSHPAEFTGHGDEIGKLLRNTGKGCDLSPRIGQEPEPSITEVK